MGLFLSSVKNVICFKTFGAYPVSKMYPSNLRDNAVANLPDRLLSTVLQNSATIPPGVGMSPAHGIRSHCARRSGEGSFSPASTRAAIFVRISSTLI